MTNEIEFNTLTTNKQEMKREEKTFFFHLFYGKFIYTDIVNSIRIKNYKNRVFRYSFLLFVCLSVSIWSWELNFKNFFFQCYCRWWCLLYYYLCLWMIYNDFLFCFLFIVHVCTPLDYYLVHDGTHTHTHMVR